MNASVRKVGNAAMAIGGLLAQGVVAVASIIVVTF
jgi:hypothetical protein